MNETSRIGAWLAWAFLLALVLASSGCLPSRVTIDLSGEAGELRESRLMDGDGREKVALIEISGLISHEAVSQGLFESVDNPVDRFVARLDRASEDPRVRALIVRVNSPGGTVAASETLYQEIIRFKSETGRPVVVSMAEVAASGGYYIALAADAILAQRGTTTGSIGVLIQTLNISDGLSRIGVVAPAVTSGGNKAMASPLEPIDEGHYALLRAMVEDFYGVFRERVRAHRPEIVRGRFDELTDGRVLSASAALEAGLIDELGGVREAFARAKSLAGVDGADLVRYHREGAEPATPYASAAASRAAVFGSAGVLSGGIGPLRLRPGVAYFIWPDGVW